jgi:hypothetical protein
VAGKEEYRDYNHYENKHDNANDSEDSHAAKVKGRGRGIQETAGILLTTSYHLLQ